MLKCNFALRHGYSPVNLLHIFRTSFYKDTSVRLRLSIRASRKSGGSKEPNKNVDKNLTSNSYYDCHQQLGKIFAYVIQLTFTCSKLTIEIPKKGVKYVQNQQ